MFFRFLKICLIVILLFSFEVDSYGEILADEVIFPQTHKLFFQAKEYYLKGDLEKAQKELQQILKLDPEDEVARKFLEMVSSELKKQTDRDEAFLTHYDLGKKYFRMKKWQEAKEELKAAVEAYPRHRDASEVISLWEKVNQRIIREAKEEAKKEVEEVADATRKQEEKLAKLKIMKDTAEEKLPPPSLNLEDEEKIEKKEILATEKTPPEPKREKPIVDLEACIQIAILNSIPIKIAKEYVELAEMKLFESWRVLFPSVVAELQDTYGKTAEGDYEARKKILQFHQLVFDGGRSIFHLHQAELSQKITQQSFQAEKQKLIYEVEQTYYKLIYAQHVVKAHKELYKKTRQYLDMTEKQYNAGYVSRLEYLNLESKFNQVSYSLVSAQQVLSLSKLGFQQVLNLDVPFALEIEAELEYNPDLEINRDRCLNLALRNRPDIRIAQLNLASSKYGEKIAKRKAWPELNLVGHIGESGEAYTQDILRMRDEWSVLAKLSWSFGGSSLDYSYGLEKDSPTEIAEVNLTTEARTHSLKFGLLDDLEYYSKSKEAEIVFQKVMNEYNELRQKVIMEIKEAYYLYERAKIMVETVKSKIKYYNKEMEIAELRKSLDIIPLSRLLETEVLLNEQQIAYSKALMEYHLALAGLNRALGISFYYFYGK